MAWAGPDLSAHTKASLPPVEQITGICGEPASGSPGVRVSIGVSTATGSRPHSAARSARIASANPASSSRSDSLALAL